MLGADAVANAEGNMRVPDRVRVLSPSGVCVAGMLENVQSRNLGDPDSSLRGSLCRNRLQGRGNGCQEVGSLHSTWEME